MDRIVGQGIQTQPDPCAPPDPREPASCDAYRRTGCSYYGLSNTGTVTWGPDPDNPGMCILDKDLAYYNSPTDFACQPGKTCGRFPARDNVKLTPGYLTWAVENNWNAIRAAGTGFCAVGVTSGSEPPPISGSCGTQNNICLSGTLSDRIDTTTSHLWSCLGSNGGTTASCTLNTDSTPTSFTTTPTPNTTSNTSTSGSGTTPVSSGTGGGYTPPVPSVGGGIVSTTDTENEPLPPTPTRTLTPLTTFLYEGVASPDLVTLTTFLKEEGHLTSTYTTTLYDKTIENAVRSFQAKEGVVSSGTPASTGYGIVGSRTRATVNRIIAEKYTAPRTSSPATPTLAPPTTSISYTFTAPLQLGTRHPDVRALQEFLNAQGYTVAESGPGSLSNETDYFGPATRSAVTRFQQDNGLADTSSYGLVGPQTRGYLNQQLVGGTSPSITPTDVATQAQIQVLKTQIAELLKLVEELTEQLLSMQGGEEWAEEWE
ncbi:MAG: peptidoglycan-binding domain-containing protein [Candidatus Paceibacterota bacterium]